MVVGSNWSPSGSLVSSVVEEDGVEDGAALGTREYFVLLGLVSAAISCRKDCNSCSAASSRDKGFEAGAFWDVGKGSSAMGAVCDGIEADPTCSGATAELVNGHTMVESVQWCVF